MYFISYYKPGIEYSEGWFGNLYVGNAIAKVSLYNDQEGFCIGIIDNIIANIEEITLEQYNEILDYADNLNDEIWFGSKLENRWYKEVEISGEILDGDIGGQLE